MGVPVVVWTPPKGRWEDFNILAPGLLKARTASDLRALLLSPCPCSSEIDSATPDEDHVSSPNVQEQ